MPNHMLRDRERTRPENEGKENEKRDKKKGKILPGLVAASGLGWRAKEWNPNTCKQRAMRVALRPRSGCLVLCLCLSALTLLLQSLWVPHEMTKDEPAGRSPEDQGQRSLGVRRLALRLEALSTQVQRLSRERDVTQLSREDLSVILQSFRQDQQGLARLVEKELMRVAQKLDQLGRSPQHHHRSNTPALQDDLRAQRGPSECEVPMDAAYPVCAEKVEFLQVRWQSDPCYAFYGVDGTACSILTYLSQIEDFCPPFFGRNHSGLPWHRKPPSNPEKAAIRTSLSQLYEVIGNSSSGPALNFIRSRVERMSERWTQAGVRMRQSSNRTVASRVLLYPGALAGSAGQRFEAMVERGGPLGELVQWADLSACLTILGHNVTLSMSSANSTGAAPGRGSCPIQRPLPFDLVYTDYHGLAHLQGAMGLAFQHYQCRFRILDSFGTEPAFNLESYANSHGYKTLWGRWGLQPLQFMTMFHRALIPTPLPVVRPVPPGDGDKLDAPGREPLSIPQLEALFICPEKEEEEEEKELAVS
ncbi:unnamed protein product [Pleuronectes platessa]|uniref:alpha-1,6-mannosyl-glycoprotein 6-beta-N-acetylglucosaminyltransferase n=1 Tax=Pleuronectes platessa TaxID=8262 RepID=A0A9N7V709_PLEPL|nr:unnamed protein product [Pleuronectes platessa]